MLIFLDTETTGIDRNDKICALGMIVETSSYFDLIHPGKKIPPQASAIHHITNEMVSEASPFPEALSVQKLQEYNRDENVLVSHNAPFDLAMLEKEGVLWQGRVIDTLKCAQSLMDDLDGYSLQFLRYELRLYRHEAKLFQHYQIPLMPHHPLSDALHTKMVVDYLLDLADEQKLIDISKSHVLLTRLPFGKYAKKRIEEIALKDPGYLKWMLESLMDMDEDLRYSIEHYLMQR